MNTIQQCDIEKQTIEALVRREEGISRLYTSCGEIFGGYRDFWLGLAADSGRHAKWLGRLYERTRDGCGKVDCKRLDIEAIEMSNTAIETLCTRTQQGVVAIADAMTNALELEEETLDSGYAEAFLSQTPEILQVQYCIQYSAKTHVEIVQALLKQIGQP